jgi:hypothetical protein
MISFKESDDGKTVATVLHGYDVDGYMSFSLSKDKTLGKDLVFSCTASKIRRYYRTDNNSMNNVLSKEITGGKIKLVKLSS